MNKKAEISWADFEKIDMRVGTVVNAEAFHEARRPAIKVWIDFGEAIGELKTSAQITDLYQPENLIGRQVAAVVNFPKKQIGSFMSECLILGVVGGAGGIVLMQPQRDTPNGLAIA
jgi:tRNA-binding protein